MTHPLTDKDIQSIWDKVGNDIVDAKDEDLDGFVEDALIRAAYDKGGEDMLERVIEWLETELEYDPELANTRPYIHLDLKEAMRPQQEDC